MCTGARSKHRCVTHVPIGVSLQRVFGDHNALENGQCAFLDCLKLVSVVLPAMCPSFELGAVDLNSVPLSAQKMSNQVSQRCPSFLDDSDIVMRVGVLLTRKLELSKYRDGLEIHGGLHSAAGVVVEQRAIAPWEGWSSGCTVGWLGNRKWLTIPGLHVKYETANDFAETLQRTWTLLTFFWGACALMPKCTHGGGSGGSGGGAAGAQRDICGEPLFVTNKRETITCRQRNCTSPAEVRCGRHGQEGLCRSCLERTRQRLGGPPGPQASTDVYDASVAREVPPLVFTSRQMFLDRIFR